MLTNESLRLVGGHLGRGRARERGKTTQRVAMARWGLHGQGQAREERGDPPTSRCDSLVVVWAGDERGRGKKAHQRVVKTRWWSIGPGTGKENHPTSQTTRWAGTSEGEAG